MKNNEITSTVFSYDRQNAIEAYKKKLAEIGEQIRIERNSILIRSTKSAEDPYWSKYDQLILEEAKHKKTDPRIPNMLKII
ncbi:hypothetical protein LCGC14_0194350 [marine sediment metagenome]|uniref:Uncharacterized protein n=1 Tax=marine sediment metagenome TaxID=412755 RepID=A0A0F9XN56_9ZZZZ